MHQTYHLGSNNCIHLFLYSREFVITVIVVTEFDNISLFRLLTFSIFFRYPLPCKRLKHPNTVNKAT
jgi:hypothetical protein